MGKALFSQIFDRGLSADISEIFGSTVIEKCSLDTDERALNAELKAEKYIPSEKQHELVNQLKNALKLNECHISCVFSEDALIPAACADITAELRLKNAALNGYFNGAEFNLNDNNVNITLKYGGYDTITDCGFENAFKRIIKERFERDITVSFDGQLEKVEIDLPPAEPAQPVRRPERQAAEPRQSAPARPAAPKKEIKFEKREGRPDNGIVYLDNPQQFYGRGGISNHTRDMISITGDDTEIACWGEVFGLETRDIKTKRGTDMTIVNFSFSDHTNSLNASLFIDTHRMGDIAPLKDGAFILVNGSYEFDNYKKRTERERAGVAEYARAGIIKKLLPIIDNIERAAGADKESPEYLKGIELIVKQFETLAGNLELTETAKAGDTFDPTLHEAVMHIEDENLGENVIAEVLQKGYKTGDTVVRHAMVKVAN
mgnify:CR=1 FL=1